MYIQPSSVAPDLSRRKLLQTTIGFFGGMAWLPDANSQDTKAYLNDALFGGSRMRDPSTGMDQFALVRVHPPTANIAEKLVLAQCHFFPHGWAIDPNHIGRAFFFEKQGPGAGVFDLKTMEQIERIEPVAKRNFYGHGVLANQGALLLSTESGLQGPGAIGVRDAKTLKYLGEFPSFGARPHDLHLVDGGRVLVVSNGGGNVDTGPAPSVVYIDVESQRLLHRHVMPGSAYNTGHLAPIDQASAIVVSAPRWGLGPNYHGAVSYCETSNTLLQVMSPPSDLISGLLGEALSVLVLSEPNLG
jgi:hypothetical protein